MEELNPSAGSGVGFAAARCPAHPEENGAAAKLLFAEQMLCPWKEEGGGKGEK